MESLFYKNKYIKYKNKYYNLKKQIGASKKTHLPIQPRHEPSSKGKSSNPIYNYTSTPGQFWDDKKNYDSMGKYMGPVPPLQPSKIIDTCDKTSKCQRAITLAQDNKKNKKILQALLVSYNKDCEKNKKGVIKGNETADPQKRIKLIEDAIKKLTSEKINHDCKDQDTVNAWLCSLNNGIENKKNIKRCCIGKSILDKRKEKNSTIYKFPTEKYYKILPKALPAEEIFNGRCNQNPNKNIAPCWGPPSHPLDEAPSKEYARDNEAIREQWGELGVKRMQVVSHHNKLRKYSNDQVTAEMDAYCKHNSI
jgi:hypothetical protein